MRILQLHCDNIEYTPTKKEIKSAEEIEPKKNSNRRGCSVFYCN